MLRDHNHRIPSIASAEDDLSFIRTTSALAAQIETYFEVKLRFSSGFQIIPLASSINSISNKKTRHPIESSRDAVIEKVSLTKLLCATITGTLG